MLKQICPVALVYRTHFWNGVLEAEILKLAEAAAGRYDVWVVGYVAEGETFKAPEPVKTLLLTERHMRVMGLPRQCACQDEEITLRNLDLSLLYFYRYIPDYQYYWMIEFDVRFSGDWKVFFKEFEDNPADFLGTTVKRYTEQPNWPHWPGLCTNGVALPERNRVKSFTPMIRLSRAAFAAVDKAYSEGWHGHYEALWPCAVVQAGLTIEDIGGNGSFTPPARRGRFYIDTPSAGPLGPGSFIFRPVHKKPELMREYPNLLWHPVKPEATPEWNSGAGIVWV